MISNLEYIQQELNTILNKYKGLSIEVIATMVGLNPDLVSSKLATVSVVNRMLTLVQTQIEKLENQMNPRKLSVKTIRLKENGFPKESMSFEQIKFMSLSTESWETSFIKHKFEMTVFIFVVFQYENINNEMKLYFKGLKIWQMPQQTIDNYIQKLWESTVEILREGVELTVITRGNTVIRKNNLPGIKDNPVAHIRPKASDSNDKVELPDGQLITKQAYWLNSKYIAQLLEDMPNLNGTASIKNNKAQSYTSSDLLIIRELLHHEIYTLDEFVEQVKKKLSNFDKLNVNEIFINSLGYKIDKDFIVSNKYKDSNEYIEKLIFKSNYLFVAENNLFKHPYVKRKIKNLENNYKLLKVEDNMYITEKCLQQGNITKEKLEEYKYSVEQHVNINNFFTVDTLRKSGFKQNLDELGFENIFYESLLKAPGRFKYLKIEDSVVFIKTPNDININKFIDYLVGEKKVISIDEIRLQANVKCNLKISLDYIKKIVINSPYYYSEELQKIFKNKEDYYEIIYK